MRWREIKSKYPNKWVAISNFVDDPDCPPNSMGEIFAFSDTEAELVKMVKSKSGEKIPLAIEYTGERLKDFVGGIWLTRDLNLRGTTGC